MMVLVLVVGVMLYFRAALLHIKPHCKAHLAAFEGISMC